MTTIEPIRKPTMRPPKQPKPLRSKPNPIPPKVREAVLERARYTCERCGTTGRLEMHHKLNRSQGGTHTEDGLAALCGPCHRWVTEHPALAREEGWSVSRWGK